MDSEEFRALNAVQVSNLEARFRYVQEIVEKIERRLRQQPGVALRSFLDDLELDLAVTQNLPEEDQTQQSAWLVHSSWTFECSVSNMRAQLSSGVIAAIESTPPSINARASEVEDWLRDQAAALRQTLGGFHSAVTFEIAIAYHIAIDIVLANLLVGSYKARLNAGLG
jgi:primosomal protein N''